MSNIIEQLLGYLKSIWQYRWIGLGVSWAVALLAALFVYQIPNRYEASARLYADTQSVLKPLLSGMAVQPNVEQQLAIISRTLISRPNVEKVLRMTDLDLSAKTQRDRDELIDAVSQSMAIKTAGQNLYTISFIHEDPETARRVVQAFLSLFVESSVGDKRKDSDSARRFLDDQIKAYEQKLVQAENALKEFKQKNLGVMPNAGSDFVGRISEATNQLNQAKLELHEQEQIREALRQQMTGEAPSLIGDTNSVQTGLAPELDSRLEALKKNLDGLRMQYTDQHPDVIQTKRLIAELEKQRAEEIKQRRAQGTVAADAQNPIYQQLRVSAMQAESNIVSLRTRVKEFESRLTDLKKNANTVPQIETDLVQLNRDYEINKKNYESLLSRREQAQISGDMEASAGVADFKIIDPPRVPPKPSYPNRILLLVGGLVGALGGGIAVALLLSQIRPTYGNRNSLREDLGLPVLGTVALIWTPAQKLLRRRSLLLFLSGTGGLVFCYSLFLGIAAWYQLK
ncbi:MAG: chain length-determining protein [Burkholderiaceae bacterium]|nr:MAG: chain length-determining protein [Burkholderiaceae bacterium]